MLHGVLYVANCSGSAALSGSVAFVEIVVGFACVWYFLSKAISDR